MTDKIGVTMPEADQEAVTTSTTRGRLGRKFKRWLKNYRVKQRRKSAAQKRTTSKKLTYALIFVLLLLFAGFAGAQAYLSPDPAGDELSLDQLSALADEKRIETAEFRDEDNQLVGSFALESIVPIEEPKDKKSDGKDNRDKGKSRNDGGGAEDPDATADDTGATEEDTSTGDEAAAAGGNDDRARDKKKNDKKKVEEEPVEEPSRAPVGAGDYYFNYPSSDAAFSVLSEMMTEAEAKVFVNPQTSKYVVRQVSQYLLPLLILASFFGLLFSAGKGGGSGIGEVLTFGSIGKKRQKRGFATPITFSDVAGADEAVAEMKEVVDYLRDPERYEEIGAVPPKGVLLFGPPGCGKTLIAKAVAGEAGVPFFSVAGAEFVESLVGVGAARVRDLFQRVRAVAPAIVFIDELDAAGRRRGYGGSGGGGSDEREQTLNQLLVEMDGFEVSTGIVVIGATNRPDIIDPALIRPGRFDRHITVEQPDAEGRELILRLHAKGKPIAPSTDWSYLAKRTPGFSGADLANVINEAALLTVRENKPKIETNELEEAIQRVLHGPKRRGVVLSEEERSRAAYHESGHAIVAASVGRSEDVHRVTILARGKGLGLTGVNRDTDALLLTRSQLLGQLVTAMGGVAAEEMVLAEPSTGSEQDLEHATELARDIVGRFGMSPTLGRARLLASDAEQFLGGDSGLAKLSDQTHTAMDAEVARLLESAEQEATRILKTHRKVLDSMATRLNTQETIEGVELDRILKVVAIKPVHMSSIFPSGSTNGRSKTGSTSVTRSRPATRRR
ncbi:MAG TPA: ATP-dependent zinc metalloprotease FtsH [Actinomycetota bacterium]|nr:ATP-dependent zinc metalloprotease FtsH [Actinomycetota bacterium]